MLDKDPQNNKPASPSLSPITPEEIIPFAPSSPTSPREDATCHSTEETVSSVLNRILSPTPTIEQSAEQPREPSPSPKASNLISESSKNTQIEAAPSPRSQELKKVEELEKVSKALSSIQPEVEENKNAQTSAESSIEQAPTPLQNDQTANPQTTSQATKDTFSFRRILNSLGTSTTFAIAGTEFSKLFARRKTEGNATTEPLHTSALGKLGIQKHHVLPIVMGVTALAATVCIKFYSQQSEGQSL
jgi:hypothetical protein